MLLTLGDFKKRIEFSLCQQFADNDDVHDFCDRVIKTRVGVACVNHVNVELAARLLKNKGIDINVEISCW